MAFTIRTAAVAATALLLSAPGAATVFLDDFDSENGGGSALNYTGFAGWTVGGNVDLVRSGDFGIACAGLCVDLDGSGGPGAIRTRRSFDFMPGDFVSIAFDVGGSQRSLAVDNFFLRLLFDGFASINIGNSIGTGGLSGLTVPVPSFFIPPTFTVNRGIAGDRSFETWSYGFTALQAGSLRFEFGTTSADAVGPLLDTVRIGVGAVVPEPATWAMLIAGFATVGAALRRRRAMSIRAA